MYVFLVVSSIIRLKAQHSTYDNSFAANHFSTIQNLRVWKWRCKVSPFTGSVVFPKNTDVFQMIKIIKQSL